MTRSSSVDWEDDIYKLGKQVNRYPYDAVVSYFLRNHNSESRANTSVLEVGCGTGNNLKFLLENDFDAIGVDYSQTAVSLCNVFLKNHGLPERGMVGDLANLPFEKNRFQVLLDRGCLTQNSHEKIREYLSEFLRVVVPGGSVLCFTLFGDRHPDMEFGVQVGEGCWDHFKEGYFKNVGLTSFFNYDILRELFKNFQTVDISKEIVYGSKNQILSEEYSVIAKT